ncbi:MAG: hypothetical protein IBJ03_15015 [Gemmatimonadaceae bacterium]|nr:hypothetical protein [Gemmatimonadaceae bacterium]
MRVPSLLSSRTLSFLSTSVLLAACGGLSDPGIPETNRYGAINIAASGVSPTSARADATVIFFEAITIAVPNSSLQQSDNCVFSTVDTLPQITRGQNRAGETVSLTAGSTTLQLAYSDTLKRYATVAGQPFSYNTGDMAQIGIPGNATVFPAQNISVKLAEPILPQPIAVPAAGAPMQVRWNGTNDNSAAIILALRYADPTSSTYANRQVYCEVKDDGSFDIPANGITSFLISPSHLRSLTITRWRTNEVMPDSKTVLHIVTSVDSTVAIP